jgi:peptidoglycan/xylan/chitin deacetylase (PgdA/CDA1 family)
VSATTDPRLLVLEYHRVAADGPERLRPWRIDPARFAAHMHHVASTGMRVLTPSAWFREPPDGASVAITFDDAYEDFASDAWPVLSELGLAAEVYVPTACVGGRSEWDGVHDAAPLMSWSRIRALRGEGVSFNSHGHTHVRLARLSEADLARELHVSRQLLQDELGSAVDTITYPYGVHDARVHAASRACGYEFGFTVEPGWCTRQSERIALPRFEVLADCDPARFAAMLAGFRAGEPEDQSR